MSPRTKIRPTQAGSLVDARNAILRRAILEAENALAASPSVSPSTQTLDSTDREQSGSALNYGSNFENYAENFENYAENFENYAEISGLADGAAAASAPQAQRNDCAQLPNGAPIPPAIDTILSAVLNRRR